MVLYQQGASNLSFDLDLCPGPDGLTADSGRLRQMLHNLIRNAIEALEGSSNGVIEVTIDSTEVLELEAIEIVVADNGPGFQTGSVSQVFDPYVTTKPQGPGLGLAIVKKLVEEHAGTIDARNRDEGGAIIKIKLPANEAAREAMIAMSPGSVEKRRERA